jgi:hypothetical protein
MIPTLNLPTLEALACETLTCETRGVAIAAVAIAAADCFKNARRGGLGMTSLVEMAGGGMDERLVESAR